MKNFIWTAALIWGSIATAICQNNGTIAKFQISILDETQILSIQSEGDYVIPTFQNESINQVLSNYTINKFEKAFPSARHQYLRKVYVVEANSINLMSDLLNINPQLFAQGQIIGENFLTYTPNDYGLATNGQKDLDLINAKTAWDNTTGSSNIVIGITDSYFNDQHEDLVNQIVNIRSNTQNIGNEHGTWVAGALAAQPDKEYLVSVLIVN